MKVAVGKLNCGSAKHWRTAAPQVRSKSVSQQPQQSRKTIRRNRYEATSARPLQSCRLGSCSRPAVQCASAGASAAGWPNEDFVPAATTADNAEAASSAGAVQTHGNASFSQTAFNVLNIMLGIGLLSLPAALQQAGWAGLGIMVLIGFATCYTGRALGECIETIARSQQRDAATIGYEEVAKAAFGSFGKAAVAAVMYTELFGICSLFFIIMGDNLHHLLSARFGLDPTTWMLVAAAAMIPTMWLPDVKSLSYLGFAGVSATLCVTATVVFTFLTRSYPAGATTRLLQPATFPIAFGCFAFCFAGHGVLPSIRASMQEPREYPKALNAAFLITGVICTLIGSLGYYMYGPAVRDVVSMNLPAGLLATLCSSLVLINPPAKFALTLEPVAAATCRAVGRTVKGAVPAWLQHFLVRTGLAVACLVTARYVPFLSLVMAIIGSFLTIGVSLIVPAACHLKLQDQQTLSRRAFNVFVILIGLVCMVSGTYSSISSILSQQAAAAV